MAVRPQRLVEVLRLDLVQPVVHWLDRLLACRFSAIDGFLVLRAVVISVRDAHDIALVDDRGRSGRRGIRIIPPEGLIEACWRLDSLDDT